MLTSRPGQLTDLTPVGSAITAWCWRWAGKLNGQMTMRMLRIQVTLEDTGSPRATITDAIIKDEDCGVK